MTTSNVDGIHFGTGEDAGSGFFALADSRSPTVINEPEAQWHYAAIQARRPEARNIWRASPQIRPANVGWSAHVFSRHVFTGIDAHHDRTGVYPTDILLLNELNLDYERGDSKNDGGVFDTNPDNWPRLYGLLSGFLEGLFGACKDRAYDRGFRPRWWFPAWAPGHGEFREDIAALWVPVARMYDAVALHSYTDVEAITHDVLWHEKRFPGQELGLFEWNTINLGEPNSSERYAEEIRIRARLRALGRGIPRLSACYFIYSWAEDRSHEHDIKHNLERTAIWNGSVAIPEDPWRLTPEPESKPEEPPVAPTYPLGIDISNNNGAIDFDRVKAAGVDFVIAKATEGVGFVDPWLANYWASTQRLGFRRGVYHYALPHKNAPEDEAHFFVDHVQYLLEPGDVAALDLEDPKAFGDLSAWTLTWCEIVEARLGFKPLIYCSPDYITTRKLRNQPKLGEYGLWLASWGVPTPPPAYSPWDLVAIHQYGVGEAGTIPGIPGEIDLNRFNGPIEQFTLYGKPFPQEPPVNPPVDPPPADPAYVVGSGILAAMQARGAQPASDEIALAFGAEAMDTEGRLYRYLRHTGITYVFTPS